MEKNDYLKELDNLTELDFIPCESSNIEGYAYNSEKRELWIAFKGNRVYKYTKVPHQVADQLHLAESKGKYHSQNIKGKFDYEGYELQ